MQDGFLDYEKRNVRQTTEWKQNLVPLNSSEDPKTLLLKMNLDNPFPTLFTICYSILSNDIKVHRDHQKNERKLKKKMKFKIKIDNQMYFPWNQHLLDFRSMFHRWLNEVPLSYLIRWNFLLRKQFKLLYYDNHSSIYYLEPILVFE